MRSSSFASVGEPLDLAHGVVSEVADGAGGERRQARQPGRFVPAKSVPQHGENVAFDVCGLAAFRGRAISRPRATMRLNGVSPMKV